LDRPRMSLNRACSWMCFAYWQNALGEQAYQACNSTSARAQVKYARRDIFRSSAKVTQTATEADVRLRYGNAGR